MAESQPGGRLSWWRRHWFLLVLSAVGLMVLVGYAVLAVTVLPGWIVSKSGVNADENHRLDAIVNTRGALLGVLAPILVAIGGVAAFLNYRVAVSNLAETTTQNRRTVELNRDTLDLTRRGQVTERFTRAIEQLGDDKLDIRLGGIDALEQIAKESQELHRPVMEILTAFLREHSQIPQEPSEKLVENEVSAPTQSEPASNEQAAPCLRADFQATAAVLGRRDVTHDPEGFSLDLGGVALGSVDFKDAQLQGANFAFSQLQGARFEGAQLQEANFDGAGLQEAWLHGAQLQDAWFRGAELREANFDDAQLQGAYFAGAKLQKARFAGAELPKANFLEARLQEAFFLEAQLQEADFSSAQLPKAYFKDAKLQKARFEFAQLQEAIFEGAGLQEAIFGFAQLLKANFKDARLPKAYFGFAQLQEAIFTGAWLQEAIFAHAQLQGTHFAGADLERACFVGPGTDESGAVDLTWGQLAEAWNVDKAVLPDYMTTARESRPDVPPAE